MRLPSMPKAATVIRRCSFGTDKSGTLFDNSRREIRFTGCLRKVRNFCKSVRRRFPRSALAAPESRYGRRRSNSHACQGVFLRREGDGWIVSDGERKRPASSAAVQALADAVSTAEVSAYQAISDDEAASFGLGRPRARSPSCQFSLRTPPRRAR